VDTAARVSAPHVLEALAGVGLKHAAYILATAEHEGRWGATLYSRSVSLVEDRNAIRSDDGVYSAKLHNSGEAWSVRASSMAEAEVAYWDAAYGGQIGNRPGTPDAWMYRGRGYVQITGRENYAKVERLTGAALISNPDAAAQPALAARILVEGMRGGWFNGRKLTDFDTYEGMRRVVHGGAADFERNAANIASRARVYERALSASEAYV
jgi:predicted chitinase